MTTSTSTVCKSQPKIELYRLHFPGEPGINLTFSDRDMIDGIIDTDDDEDDHRSLDDRTDYTFAPRLDSRQLRMKRREPKPSIRRILVSKDSTAAKVAIKHDSQSSNSQHSANTDERTIFAIEYRPIDSSNDDPSVVNRIYFLTLDDINSALYTLKCTCITKVLGPWYIRFSQAVVSKQSMQYKEAHIRSTLHREQHICCNNNIH